MLSCVLLLVLLPRAASACAGCRNPALPLNRGSQGELAPETLRVGASLSGTTVHVVHQAGCPVPTDCSETPAQPAHLHDQYLYPLELRLSGEYALSRAWGLELQLPFRSVTTTIRYRTLDGADYQPLDPDVHHRDETVLGAADPWLLLRVGDVVDGWWLAARPGLSLPLGSTEEDPFELGERGARHQHIQLGTGTFDPVLVLEASRQLGAYELSLFAQGQLSLYDNQHGYRAPWKVAGGAALGRDVLGKLGVAFGAEAFHEAAERWSGRIRQDGTLGRSELLAALSVRQRWERSLLTLSLRVPVWRHIVVGDEPAGTLSSPVGVGLSFSQLFGSSTD